MKTKALLLMILVALCPALLYSQWAAVYGGPGDDGANVIRRTPDGGYVIGWGNGLLKMSALGVKEWDIPFTRTDLTVYDKVWVAEDGSIFAVAVSYLTPYQDPHLFKVSPGGTTLWQNRFGSGARINTCRPTVDGGAFLAGAALQGDAWDPLVMKVAAGGDIEWQKVLTPDQPSELTLALAASGGNYVAAGRYRMSSINHEPDLWVVALDSTGGVLWQKTIAWAGDYGVEIPWILHLTSDGGCLIGAIGDSHSEEGRGPLLVKLGPQGAVDWLRVVDGVPGALRFRETPDEAIIAAALDTATYRDFNVLKLALDGTVLWQRSYQSGRTLNDLVLGSPADGGGAIALKVEIPIAGSGVPDYDGCLVKVTPTGETAWQKLLGTACAWDGLLSLEQTDDAGIMAGGQTRSWGSGGFDAWILKFKGDGEVNPYCGFIREADFTAAETTYAARDVQAVVQEPALNVTAGPVVIQLSNIISGTSNAVLTMLGQPQSILTLRADAGGTTDPAPGTSTYGTGTSVTIRAIPQSGYSFSVWSGACSASGSNTANPITFVMDGDKTVTAHFYKPSDGGGGGTDDDWGGGGSVDDDWGGGGGAKKCFVATAAYGSPLHPHVRYLREFRDRYLIKTGAGRAVVRFYYRVSPPVAAFITEHKAARTAVRILLLPFVGFAHLALKAGPIPATLALGIVIFGGALFVRRRWKARKARAQKII